VAISFHETERPWAFSFIDAILILTIAALPRSSTGCETVQYKCLRFSLRYATNHMFLSSKGFKLLIFLIREGLYATLYNSMGSNTNAVTFQTRHGMWIYVIIFEKSWPGFLVLSFPVFKAFVKNSFLAASLLYVCDFVRAQTGGKFGRYCSQDRSKSMQINSQVSLRLWDLKYSLYIHISIQSTVMSAGMQIKSLLFIKQFKNFVC
jgi:hypothetical protein